MVRTLAEGKCPICGEQAESTREECADYGEVDYYQCSRCCFFGLRCDEDMLKEIANLSAEQRERLSHEIRNSQDGETVPLLTSSALRAFIKTRMFPDMVRLPMTTL